MEDPKFFAIAFPFLFVGMWLAVGTMLGFMSGWFNLQQWYDAPSEKPLLKLRGQSGSMGLGVSLGGILTLSAHQRGLGIGIWRIFGPFQRPFLVPWNEIEATPSKTWFTPMVKLSLGKPAIGSLKINARSWSKLVDAAGAAVGLGILPAPRVSNTSIARGMLLEWFATTAFAATFFYFGSRLPGDVKGMPLNFASHFQPSCSESGN